jgi:protein gp37
MNKQAKTNGRRGIEWTDYTFNPIAGCKHGCRWIMPDGTVAECYAETVAERVAQAAYPHGFEHHYWRPELLREPLALKTPSRIFLDSMADLMGHWVPEEQIHQVLETCARAHWHTFQLLTKNAPRLRKFRFPPNVWVGVSAPPSIMMGRHLTPEQQARMVTLQLEVLREVDVPVRWMSIEPLSFDIAPLLRDSGLQWAVVGAATNGAVEYQPKRQWVRDLLRTLDAQGTKVFFKGNLYWPKKNGRWREDWPPEAQRPAFTSQETQLTLLSA